ncbi:DinB family protein [Flavivirga algicola]|uniref:DinB family protein n=1 Tax=Flavivirga algicola TaxID=2729136 RepID=A0ABX1S059_9FLAO|nr:DinB family protein [Flavivirga algicola]NMH88027.1 hypothetical protein [Flavivirga algicola]
MKFKIILVASFMSIVFFMAFTRINKQNPDYHYLKERLQKTKLFTVEVIKAMPESDYMYKPTKEVRSYTALVSHTVYSIEWNIELMKGTPIKWEPDNENRYSKEHLITYANDQFDKLIAFINNAKESTELTDKIIDVLNHNAHHRGQMTIYLRMKGITPPNYR